MTTRTAILTLAAMVGVSCASAQQLPERAQILKTATLVNNYFMKKYADYTAPSNVGRLRPSNIWTRGVYYEGLMSLYEICPDEACWNYAFDWAQYHKWNYRNGASTRNADDYCAGQTYIDLSRLTADPTCLRHVRANMAMLLSTPQNDDWTWIDAIQMGMPVLAKLGRDTGDPRYFDKMWRMYSCTRNTIGGGLFNTADNLWWRDADFVPPYVEPNGEDCYWSRGNGWVYAALVRVMNEIPATETHYADYLADFKAMSDALRRCQRTDGFWNVSLHCPENFGGPETSGTALFVYGMAWGINHGVLSRETYLPIVVRAWNAMAATAVHPDGFLGYVQGTGKEPKDSQPVGYDTVPDFEDFGVGCFLLAATEVYRIVE